MATRRSGLVIKTDAARFVDVAVCNLQLPTPVSATRKQEKAPVDDAIASTSHHVSHANPPQSRPTSPTTYKPVKSISSTLTPEERERQDLFQLDISDALKNNPKSLLYKRGELEAVIGITENVEIVKTANKDVRKSRHQKAPTKGDDISNGGKKKQTKTVGSTRKQGGSVAKTVQREVVPVNSLRASSAIDSMVVDVESDGVIVQQQQQKQQLQQQQKQQQQQQNPPVTGYQPSSKSSTSKKRVLEEVEDGEDDEASAGSSNNQDVYFGSPVKITTDMSSSVIHHSKIPRFTKPLTDDVLKSYCARDARSTCPVVWERAQRQIFPPTTKDIEKLTEDELNTCQVLRIPPCQYLEIRNLLVQADYNGQRFPKRTAQSWFRVDVTKVGRLIDWLHGKGWLPNSLERKEDGPKKKVRTG
ncbi:hypothetical protein HDU76_008716 [Blyttiomyces sp. JEL0837]|nr:hypothetical protein HDU76_008716 [Blyttiomyces sp. JEL0837]